MKSTLNTQWLETFIAVIGAGKQTAVAIDMGRDQGTVSRHIKKLEAWLGGTLLFNGNVPAELSPAGEAFLPVAKEVLSLLAEAQRTAKLPSPPPPPPVSGKDIEIF